MTLFAALTYALIALGLLSLRLAEIVSWPVFLLVAILIALSPLRRQLRLEFSRNFANAAMVAILLFLLWGAVVGGPTVYVRQLLYFSLALLVAKLYGPKAYRDHLQIFLISAFYLIAATMKIASLSFLLVFLIFLALALAYLVLLNLRRDAESCAPDPGATQPPSAVSVAEYHLPREVARFVGRGFLWRTLRYFAFVLGLSIAGFYLIPRFTLEIFARPQELVELTTGFSESVELGNLGEILSNQTPVMKVFIESGPPRSRVGLRWRGITLDEFDGSAWRVSEAVRSEETLLFPQTELSFALPQEGPANTVQRLELEPINTQMVFVQPEALQLRLERFPRRSGLTWSNVYSLRLQPLAGNLFFSPVDRPSFQNALRRWKEEHPQDTGQADFIRRFHQGPTLHQPIAYRVASHVNAPDPAELRQSSDDDPEEIRRVYLQLPPGMERVAELARSVVANHTNRYDRAEALELFLRREFDYTLVPTSESRNMSLEDFVLEVRRGHCEYFSAAMGVMLRTLGIPARVVNGFVGSEYHRFGGYYQVRQSDAHSWVEVFFPGQDWIPFDPTPPQRGGGLQLSRRLRQLFDLVQSGWVKYVVDFSFYQQRQLFGGIYSFLRPGRTGSALPLRAERESAPMPPWRSAWLWVGLFAVGLGVWSLYTQRGSKPSDKHLRSKKASPDVRSAIAFYQRLLKLLARNGFKRRSGQTPAELAEAVAVSAPPLGEAVHQVTSAYYAVRYGKEPLSSGMRRQLEESLRVVRQLSGGEIAPIGRSSEA